MATPFRNESDTDLSKTELIINQKKSHPYSATFFIYG